MTPHFFFTSAKTRLSRWADHVQYSDLTIRHSPYTQLIINCLHNYVRWQTYVTYGQLFGQFSWLLTMVHRKKKLHDLHQWAIVCLDSLNWCYHIMIICVCCRSQVLCLRCLIKACFTFTSKPFQPMANLPRGGGVIKTLPVKQPVRSFGVYLALNSVNSPHTS